MSGDWHINKFRILDIASFRTIYMVQIQWSGPLEEIKGKEDIIRRGLSEL